MKGNVLVLKDLPKNSKWCDKDHVMLLACFQILTDFLEKEKPQTIVDYSHDREHRKHWKELQALYRYWKHDRHKQERQIDALRRKWAKSRKTKMVPSLHPQTVSHVVVSEDRKTWRLLRSAETRFEKLEEEMLLRLISVRKHLWC